MNSFPNFNPPNYSHPVPLQLTQHFIRHNNNFATLSTPRQTVANYRGRWPKPVENGWNYPFPSQQQGLSGGCSSIPPGFGFIAPPKVVHREQRIPLHQPLFPATVAQQSITKDEEEVEYDNEEERLGAHERFNRNDTMMNRILDGDIANCKPSFVSTERVESLKRQSELLQNEVDKEKEEVLKTRDNCDSQMRGFHESTTHFYEKIAELSRPVSTADYDAMEEKYYHELKRNLNGKLGRCYCDGNCDKGVCCRVVGIQIPKLDWKTVTPAPLANVSREALQSMQHTVGTAPKSDGQIAPPCHHQPPGPRMNAGPPVSYNYPRQTPPPTANAVWLQQQQQQNGGQIPTYYQGLPTPHQRFGVPLQHSNGQAVRNRYLHHIPNGRQVQREMVRGYVPQVSTPPVHPTVSLGFNQIPPGFPPQMEQRLASNRFLNGGGIVEVASSPSSAAVQFSADDVGMQTGGELGRPPPTSSGNNWVNGHEIEELGGEEDVSTLRFSAPTLARLLEAPSLDVSENKSRQFTNSNVLFSSLTEGNRHAGSEAGNASSTVVLADDDEIEIQEGNGMDNGSQDEFQACEMVQVQNGRESIAAHLPINLHRRFQDAVEEITLSDEDSE